MPREAPSSQSRSAHATTTDGVWRVMRFENAAGKWAEVASNHVGPEAVPVPPGYKFVNSTPMVPRADVERLREVIRDVGSAWRGGEDAEIATAIDAATDAAGFREQEGG